MFTVAEGRWMDRQVIKQSVMARFPCSGLAHDRLQNQW